MTHPSPPPSRGISHQLRLTALLQADEPKDGLLDRAPHSQEAVVLQQRRLPLTKRLRDIAPFLIRENNAIEVAVDGKIVVEGARVLRDGVDRSTERTERAAIYGMAVGGRVDVRTGVVDGGVDAVCGGVEEPCGAAADDLAGVGDVDEIGRLDEGECDAEGVHPERIRVDGVL